MATLTPAQIYSVALQAGFSPDQARTWTAIALAESGGNSNAHAGGGEDSWGLWQINLDAHDNAWGDLRDPLNNARAAYEISNHGTNLYPWSVTHDDVAGTARDYRQYLDEAEAAVGGLHQPDGSDNLTQRFLDAAVDQTGDPYIFGSEAAPSDTDPDVFDCSELTQWSAHQVGIDLPDGSWLQFLELKSQGLVIPVEDAVNTPGALLFSFSSEPVEGGGRPSSAHVAISLGDGQTIEARGRAYGVGSFEATPERFQYAAVLPGLTGDYVPGGAGDLAAAGPDSDHDGLGDYDEIARGLDPADPDSDDDGLLDGLEALAGSDPLLRDTDSDGLSDTYEAMHSRTDPALADTDADGMTDDLELLAGRDPLRGVPPPVPGMSAATDGSPIAADTDADGLSDAYEVATGTDPNAADSDLDTLDDSMELLAGTDPTNFDTDGDGVTDGYELSMGDDPLEAAEGMFGPPVGSSLGLGEDLDDADIGTTESIDDADPVPST